MYTDRKVFSSQDKATGNGSGHTRTHTNTTATADKTSKDRQQSPRTTPNRRFNNSNATRRTTRGTNDYQRLLLLLLLLTVMRKVGQSERGRSQWQRINNNIRVLSRG